MKVNDYVRTRWGCIAKFEGLHEGFYEFDNIILDESSAVREKLFVDIVEKSSPNIIDLIEVGDYINGFKVDEIDEKGIYNYNSYDGWSANIASCNEDIESIVTKEQFLQSEYRIGE